LRELANTRQLGAMGLVAVGSLLFWSATMDGYLHKSPLSLYGMDPARATRPLSYVDRLDDVSFLATQFSVFFTHIVRCVTVLSHLDVETGAVTSLSAPAAPESPSVKLLDARNGVCLVGLAAQRSTSVYVVTQGSEWRCVGPEVVRSSVELAESAVVHVDDDSDYVVHRLAKPGSMLCLFLHGGPHAAVDTAFHNVFDALLSSGVSVIAPNYLGSTGQPHLERLAGRIGELDVASVAACLAHERKRNDYGAVVCFGGSHGGFLAATMQTRSEFDFVAAYAMRNPVVALDAMLFVTDIPDWSLVEGLNKRSPVDFSRLESGDLQRLREKSPLAHLATHASSAKTLLGLGGRDMRVPCSQGKLWSYALAARGVPCTVLLFPDEDHALGGPCEQQWHDAVVAHFRDAQK
jgi:acetyl esterase/lipase